MDNIRCTFHGDHGSSEASIDERPRHGDGRPPSFRDTPFPAIYSRQTVGHMNDEQIHLLKASKEKQTDLESHIPLHPEAVEVDKLGGNDLVGSRVRPQQHSSPWLKYAAHQIASPRFNRSTWDGLGMECKMFGNTYDNPSSTADTDPNSQSYYKNETRSDSPSSDTITSAPVYPNPHSRNCSSVTTSKPKDPVQVTNEILPVAGHKLNIKLLQIIPSDRGCDTSTGHHSISCLLETFEWEVCPKFIALSYVWGKGNPQHTILINNEEFGIRRNLHSALEHFEKEAPLTYLWADAICIDQTNEEEKSIQVQNMGKIFSHAVKVFAWIGPPDEIDADCASIEADPKFYDLVGHLEHLGSIFWEKSNASGQKLNEASFDLQHVFQCCLPYLEGKFRTDESYGGFPVSSYATFSNNLYWQRIWVLQEVYLAKDLWFFYGLRKISARILSGAIILLEQFQKHIVASFDESVLVHISNPLYRFAFGRPSFPEMHRLIIYTSIYPANAVSLRVAMNNFCVKELPRGSRATDPRDMIFGLLGFANSREMEYIKADYSKPVQETYRDVTRALVAHGFADVVAWSQPDEKRIQGLPSWVPDFSATIYEPLCSQGQAKPWLPRFNAAAGRPAVLWCGTEEQSSSEKLSLLGVTLDEISEVGTLWNPRISGTGSRVDKDQLYRETMPTRSASYEAISTLLSEIRDFVTSNPGVGTKEAVFRVACADQLVLDSKLGRAPGNLNSYYIRALKAVRVHLVGSGKCSVDPGARPYIETMLRWVKKRPIRTSEGYVGLAPGKARKGDILVILYGFSAPLVLRKLGEYGERLYEVVGESYICGMENGEGIDGLDVVEDLFYLI